MQKTKIEVLLDKMLLVMEEADAILNEVDKRLLEKYARQIAALLDTDDNDQTAKQGPADAKEEDPTTPSHESPTVPNEPANRADSKERLATPGKPRVDPLNEESSDSASFSFVEDESAEKRQAGTDEEKSGPSNKEQQPQQDHAQIYKDLEEIRKNREATQKLMEEEENDDEAERPPVESPSVNDRFIQSDSDIVDHLKGTPIRNLQQEIDLNDKFWFINELFEGDATTFNELLKELDALHSFEDARELINEKGAQKFDWPESDRAAQRFYQVVRRRYL